MRVHYILINSPIIYQSHQFLFLVLLHFSSYGGGGRGGDDKNPKGLPKIVRPLTPAKILKLLQGNISLGGKHVFFMMSYLLIRYFLKFLTILVMKNKYFIRKSLRLFD